MQFPTIVTFLVVTIASVSATPAAGRPPKEPRPTPVIIHNSNTCSAGYVYCCAPNDDNEGTICKQGVTQCNAITICCNNNNVGGGIASQSCFASASLIQPVIWG